MRDKTTNLPGLQSKLLPLIDMATLSQKMLTSRLLQPAANLFHLVFPFQLLSFLAYHVAIGHLKADGYIFTNQWKSFLCHTLVLAHEHELLAHRRHQS